MSLQAFANLEDTKLVAPQGDKKLICVDPDVERVRRYIITFIQTNTKSVYYNTVAHGLHFIGFG